MNYQPMLCKLGKKSDLDNDDYIYEPKLDGTRAIVYINKKTKIINRRNRNITHRYPEFVFKVNAKSCVLDGEIIVYDKKGHPNFNLLQKRDQLEKDYLIEARSEQYPATFVVFDILELNKKKLLNKTLKQRKQILKQTIIENENLELIPYTDNGINLWKEVVKHDVEGVVAKKINSKYLQDARSRDWIKVKYEKTIDAVILGYTSEKRKISALALGCYFDSKLKYVGRVGTGFDEKTIEMLYNKLRKLKRKTATAEYEGKKEINWVSPKLVAEIKYLNITKDRILRAPVFLRLRTDKPPKDCKWEEQV